MGRRIGLIENENVNKIEVKKVETNKEEDKKEEIKENKKSK